MKRIVGLLAVAACRSETPPPAPPPAAAAAAAPVAPAAEPKRELVASSPLGMQYDFMHGKWLAMDAKPTTVKGGQECRDGAMAMSADEFPDKLRGCTAACDAGDPASCTIVAGWLMNASGNEAADRARSLVLYDRACQSHGDPLACFFLGEQLDRGPHVAKHDPARARAAWRAGCDQHEDNSCAALRGERIEMETTEIYRAPGK